MTKFTIHFEKYDEDSEQMERKAIVNIILDRDTEGLVKFDVDLNSLPTTYIDGYEVVASFQAHDFDNNGTFYTDSNGLEMQKRVLNYRSYYDFMENEMGHHQNITANYYPIN